MPIVKDNPDSPSTIKPNLPKALSPVAKSNVVDTKYTPIASLITYVSGAHWTVDFFSQAVDVDNNLHGQDVSQSPLYQQYTCIKGLEVKVQSALTSSQDENNRMIVSGSASVYPFVIPNIGDMFAADVGDGREGVFRIKNVEKKSLLRQSVYTIDYDLQYYSEESKDKRKDLADKTIRTVFFVKDFLLHGQNPLVIEEDFYIVQTLENKYFEIVKNYMSWFYNNDLSTLVVPGQSFITYDHFLTDAVLSILNTTDAEQIKYIKRLNVDGDMYLKQPQLWQALIERDKSLIELSNRRMGLVDVKTFGTDPVMESIAYGGVKYMVYPFNPDTSLNSIGTMKPRLLSANNLTNVLTRPGNLQELIGDVYVDNILVTVPPIIDVLETTGYVLSNDFYENKNERSLLEVLVNAYFNKQAINSKTLLKLIQTYKSWGGLERFYYLPIILILIKTVIRNT